MEKLRNPVQRYAWGSATAIPELTGDPADGTPVAELWMGAHPSASSAVLRDGAEMRLDVAVEDAPEVVLGRDVVARFGPRLPFLLKVLAAERPLSLQVHPTAAQAEAGYLAEQDAGEPVDSPRRRYRDPHHKPEMLVALTPFEVLCGFRHPEQVLAVLDGLAVPALHGWRDLLTGADEARALEDAFAAALGGDLVGPDAVRQLAAACGARLERGSAVPDVDATVVRLAREHPGDPGVVVSLLLNRGTLQPGEALFVGAGVVHAYLGGTALELMACSDNVLRGGLTSKLVDVPELLRTVRFEPGPLPRMVPEVTGEVRTWRPPVPDFQLSVVEPGDGQVPVPGYGPRIVLCLQGAALLAAGGRTQVLRRGESALVRDTDGDLRVGGPCRVVIAAVRQAP